MSQLIETRKVARKSTRSTKMKSELIGDKDGNCEVPSEENDLGSDSEVRCFCNDKREMGEMRGAIRSMCRMVPFEVFKNERGSWYAGWKSLRLLFLFVCDSVRIDKVGW